MKLFLPLFSLPCLTAAAQDPCGADKLTLNLSSIELSSYYTYVSPSAAGPKLGIISFDLSNSQVNYTTHCRTAQSVSPFGNFYGFMWWNCTAPGAVWPDAETRFSFETAGSVVVLNTTWSCGGDVVYTTSAPGRVDNWGCMSWTWQNPDWQPGEIWSNTTTWCGVGEVVLVR
ncbi:hypothetical protein FB567DRAFT_576929 [Paraphoma chrysanthemicola]|uniref:AA1-like domain-containing protein n=1 Tax=Paraphoma chrysanthemicola TaxID=798071 RepID=A0A8K0RGZ9_9PLEO|nr:hypothetical protein FB567DRAFT_576929 [Paraphoma chrysanthemicola]